MEFDRQRLQLCNSASFSMISFSYPKRISSRIMMELTKINGTVAGVSEAWVNGMFERQAVASYECLDCTNHVNTGLH